MWVVVLWQLLPVGDEVEADAELRQNCCLVHSHRQIEKAVNDIADHFGHAAVVLMELLTDLHSSRQQLHYRHNIERTYQRHLILLLLIKHSVNITNGKYEQQEEQWKDCDYQGREDYELLSFLFHPI